MKKYIKLFSILILGAIVSLNFASCSDNGYSLGDQWMSMATTGEDGNNSYFVLDDNTTLFVAATSTGYQPKNRRVVINYTILSDNYYEYDHAIKLNGYYYDVLTKDVIYVDPTNPVEQDTIGSNPIKIKSVWEGGGYLNIKFGYNTGGKTKHLVNLTSTKPDLSLSEDVVDLEFRHNRFDDPEHYWSEGIVSFDLAPYRTEGRDQVTFKIKIRESEQEYKTYEILYKYKK